ncbi:MAG: porin [Gammaproteobacteria bacterium]|nr:porin [Gammaproteobacteria bacterium]
MKFRTTALAVAIAGIAAAPIASAETVLSGIVEVGFSGSDADDDPTTTDVDEGGLAVAAGDVFAGITSNHTMNSGLNAYGSLRYDLNGLSGAAFSDADSVYVGIKGGFGDVRLGEVPNAIEYGQVAGDLNDIEGAVNGGLSYTGSFGPVGLGLSFSPENNQDSFGAGVKFNFGGFAIGVGAGSTAEVDKLSAGASFSYAGASIAAHMTNASADAGDADNIAVKVGYAISGVSIGVTAHMSDEADFDTKLRLDLGYDLGGNMNLNSRINSNTGAAGGGDDSMDWRIRLSKSF